MTKTKYQLISDEIRSKILSNAYPKGSNIPSETQLQKEYDVSRHTVRQAVALLVNEGFLAAATVSPAETILYPKIEIALDP